MNICRLQYLQGTIFAPLSNSGGFSMRGRDGQALAELMFAFAMAILLLSGMIVAVQAGLSNTLYAQHKAQSILYAEEFADRLQAALDVQYLAGPTTENTVIKHSTTLARDVTTGLLHDDTGAETIFTVDPIPLSDAPLYTIRISWQEKDRVVETVIRREYYRWR